MSIGDNVLSPFLDGVMPFPIQEHARPEHGAHLSHRRRQRRTGRATQPILAHVSPYLFNDALSGRRAESTAEALRHADIQATMITPRQFPRPSGTPTAKLCGRSCRSLAPKQ